MITTDVVIIGGGIIGCSIAYALRKRGAGVCVCDQGEIGAQVSRAASGLLAPLKPFAKLQDPYTLLLLSSLRQVAALITEVEAISGIRTAYVQTGTVRVRPAKQESRLQTWIETWQQAGFPLLELLKGDEIQLYEPALATKQSVALYNPYEMQLDAPQFMRAVGRAAEKLGAILYPHEAVITLRTSGASVTEVQTSQGKVIRCHHLVLATGAWVAQAGEWLGLTLPVRPIRAQSLTLPQSSIPLQHMIFGEGIYLAPKENGTLLIGVARDEVGFNVETTTEGKTWLHERATRLVPSLASCSIDDAWAGLLPATPDARPILGTTARWHNVTLACGYNGYGLLLSASTGDLLADSIISGQPSEVLHPFLLERFA